MSFSAPIVIDHHSGPPYSPLLKPPPSFIPAAVTVPSPIAITISQVSGFYSRIDSSYQRPSPLLIRSSSTTTNVYQTPVSIVVSPLRPIPMFCLPPIALDYHHLPPSYQLLPSYHHLPPSSVSLSSPIPIGRYLRSPGIPLLPPYHHLSLSTMSPSPLIAINHHLLRPYHHLLPSTMSPSPPIILARY